MNPHSFNAWSFLSGALFVLIAAGWTLVAVGAAEPVHLLRAAPVALIALGVGGLALTLRKAP
ncbi:MAG: hypothetical protein QM621_09805 [Aeromicrobium sp.]|uniref:hypothetical protein n=1 Tax=Aeromicrobium sp. TaxID=1871063 RepID=UPI0039E333FC